MKRVISNYMRLILTFVIGIVIVRIMAEIGSDAALIYLLLISSTGIAAMFKFALQNALVPALGLSIDGSGEHDFARVFWTSFVMGLGSGLVSGILFWIFWMVSDQLDFGDLSQRTVSIALASTAVQALSTSVGVVFLNLILVERRIITYNMLLILERVAILLPALLIFALDANTTIDRKVHLFYILAGVTTVLLQVLTYVLSNSKRPELRLRRTPLSWKTTRWIGVLIGWNAVVVIAFALFTRWPPLVVNWSMGETMTLTISIVLLLIGYQRQLSMGLVVGLDAMVARLIAGGGEQNTDARVLIIRSTYILTIFAAFSVAAISLFVEDILVVWFSDSLDDSGWTPQRSADLFRIMSFGIAASVLSEGWMKFLSGRGEVVAYAPHLLIAGTLNIIGVGFASALLEPDQALKVIAVVFSASFVVVNFGFIGVNTARRLDVPVWRFYLIIALPALVAALATVPGVLMRQGAAEWSLGSAAIALAVLAVGLGVAFASMWRANAFMRAGRSAA